MTLAQYLSREGSLKPTELARLIGRHVSTVTLLRDGLRRPSMETVEAIFKATGGAVAPADWMATGQEDAA